MEKFSHEEKERYLRQFILPAWGEDAQAKVRASTVLVVGLGGLGSPVCLYLVAAGVGRIILCDSGLVELSNLNRQILYQESDLGLSKALVAAERLHRLNHHPELIVHQEHLDDSNLPGLVSQADIVVDCLDNIQTRHALNRSALAAGIPLVHGGIFGTSCQFAFLHPPLTPCFRCLFPEGSPVAPGPIPVIGATVGIVASLQAQATLRFLASGQATLPNRLWLSTGWEFSCESLVIQRDVDCPACGHLKVRAAQSADHYH